MIRFIFKMLFCGAFLGVFVIFCMWFFLGVSVQQSVDWILQKTTQVVSAPKKIKFQTPGQKADAQIKKISDMIK